MATRIHADSIASELKDGPKAKPTMRSLGTGAHQAAAGNDPRFGGGSSSGSIQWMETPGGVVNGSNTIFTLVLPPSPSTALMLFVNGVLQRQGGDYTLLVDTITMTTAPVGVDVLRATYPF